MIPKNKSFNYLILCKIFFFLFFETSCVSIIKYEKRPPNLKKSKYSVKLSVSDLSYSFKSISGEMVRLNSFKGKIIFINHWATWCSPCVKEMPSLNKLYEAAKDQPIIFLFISNESKEQVEHFVQKHSLSSLPFYTAVKAEKPTLFDNTSWPTTYIIDKNSNLVIKHTSTANWSHQSVTRYLKKLMYE